MKRMLCVISVLVLYFSVVAQPANLFLSTHKTTSLVFPFPIKHVDRGSPAILVQPVKEADHILLVKAAGTEMPETNLSVITSDGSVYAFTVCYAAAPVEQVIHLPALTQLSVAQQAMNLLDNARTLRGMRHRSWGMDLEVTGIYIKGNVLYFQLVLQNGGAIDYDIDLLRCFIRDRNVAKRTAIQEVPLHPLHIAGNQSKVPGEGASTFVIALDKFTIPDAQFFAIHITEKHGGRHLRVKVKNRQLIQAIRLPDAK